MSNIDNYQCSDKSADRLIGGVHYVKTFYFGEWPIRYRHAGKGPPVILLHNGGTAHVIWREILPYLTDHYELFAFDLLGYGASAKPGPAFNYTLDRYIDFLVEFIGHHRLAPVTLVGNCMGSAMSLGLAHRRPELVRSLVLMNPLTEATFLGGILGLTLRLRQRAPGFSRAIYKVLGRIRMPVLFSPLVLSFQIGAHGKSRKVHKDSQVCACFAVPGLMNSLLGVLDDLSNYSYLDRVEPGRDFPPLCTVWGRQNKILSPKVGRKLNATLKPQRQEWLEGCGHLLMLEQPEEVALIVREFLLEGEHHEKEMLSQNKEGLS